MQKKRYKSKEPFIQIPHSILNSVAYKNLGAWSCKLLIELVKKFNGKNNGDLSYPYSEMKRRGFNSSSTLSKAGKELEQYGFIEITKLSRKIGTTFEKTKLVALTWLPINECQNKQGQHKLDVNATTSASNLWKKFEAVPDLEESKKIVKAQREKQLMKDIMGMEKDYRTFSTQH